MTDASAWTPDEVGLRLVEAFRRLPGRPVLSSSRGFTINGAAVEPFGWPERFVAEARDRRILLTWARCRAGGDPVRAAYREFGWPLHTAERRRRRALAAITAGLNRERSGEAAA